MEVQARHHPRALRYPAPAAARALAHAVERPRAVLTGFSALAVYGLPYLVEGHDTTLSCPVAANSNGGALTPTIRRSTHKPEEVWTVKVQGYPFRVAAPAVATVQALKTSGSDILRAVQLVDCVRRYFSITPEALREAGHYRIRKPWLDKVVRLSSALADSPKETEMRLMVQELSHRFHVSVREQYPVFLGSRLITVFDLALLEPKIGLMYDGQHHWDFQQRQKDSLINLEVTTQGWTPLRFSAGTLPELPQRLGRLLSEKC
ncbi:hypothetical protein [Corynebacterium mycetoides]|uniref:hypothetical protein n=1 Tax=Corynebacterium mycetoides TaxID=38302 RepID=UPI0012F94084|nr:hypothetical protein [Corynebacterium mycetoides]